MKKRTPVHPLERAEQADILRLAMDLYEASNTTGVPFASRGRPIRDAWLREATRRRAAGGSPQ